MKDEENEEKDETIFFKKIFTHGYYAYKRKNQIKKQERIQGEQQQQQKTKTILQKQTFFSLSRVCLYLS